MAALAPALLAHGPLRPARSGARTPPCPRPPLLRLLPRGSAASASDYASQITSSSSSSSRAISCSMPASSARISVAPRELAAEQAVQHRVEEQHRVRAERPVRPAGLEEVDRRARSGRGAGSRGRPARRARRAAPRVGLVREAHATPRSRAGRRAGRSRPAPTSNAWYAAAPRSAKITCWIVGDRAQLVAHRSRP